MSPSRDLNGRHKAGHGPGIGLTVALAITLVGPSAFGAEQSGERVVAEVCAKCHATGEKGAPKIGDKLAWSKRAAVGLNGLTEHAITGLRQMPAHGGNPGLSDHELQRAITFMVNRSGGDWVEPINAAMPTTPRSGEQIVRAKCSECHQTGKNGAPRIGDLDAWSGRVKLGLDKVVASAIHGHGPMPPRGGMADLTDAEIHSAVVYMFTQSTASLRRKQEVR